MDERRAAVIEIGTNSVKFCMARRSADGVSFDAERVAPARLGEGLRATRRLSDEAMERNADAAAGFAALARSLGADKIAVVATMAARSARNGAEFAERVRARCGMEPRVLSGEEEARLAFSASRSCLSAPADAAALTMDVGGGSTELVYTRGGAILRQFSADVGAVTLTESLGLQNAVPATVLAQARDRARAAILRGGAGEPAAAGVGLGGGVTALAAAALSQTSYDASALHGFVLSEREVESLIARFAAVPAEERCPCFASLPGRADIALAGACIVAEAMEAAGLRELTVCSRGVRHALALELLEDPREPSRVP